LLIVEENTFPNTLAKKRKAVHIYDLDCFIKKLNISLLNKREDIVLMSSEVQIITRNNSST